MVGKLGLSENILNELNQDIYTRDDSSVVSEELEKLGVSPSSFFIDFYRNFEGPFWSEKLGFELLDIEEDSPNISDVTAECRETFNFPKKYLALCELSVGQIFVLDCETDSVFAVNFEGEEERLVKGELEPRWASFKGFIESYF
jgi:hypothetical protein